MEKILSFSTFTEQNSAIEESEIPSVNEAADIQALARSSSSKADLKNKLVAKLKKNAPSLADDSDFIDKLASSFDSEEEEKAK